VEQESEGDAEVIGSERSKVDALRCRHLPMTSSPSGWAAAMTISAARASGRPRTKTVEAQGFELWQVAFRKQAMPLVFRR
jgi:hypothetical protein